MTLINDQFWYQLDSGFYTQLRDCLWKQVPFQLVDQLYGQLGHNIDTQCGAHLHDHLDRKVKR